MNARQFKKHNSLLEKLCNRKIRLIYPKRGCNYKKLFFKRSYKYLYQVDVKKRHKSKDIYED